MRFCILAIAASKARCASPPRPWVVSWWAEGRVTAPSTLQGWPSRLTTTSAPPPPRSKYFPMLEESSSETRERRASPTSTCLPVTWTCMGGSTRLGREGVKARPCESAALGVFLEPAPTLHRRGDAHGLAVL